jgi:hypothetical protein
MYEGLVGKVRGIYGHSKILLPRPQYIVLYDGVEPYADDSILRLSDSFKDIGELGLSEEAKAWGLELTVRVININRGHSEGVLSRSPLLKGYSAFVGKVREFEGERKALKGGMLLTPEEKAEVLGEAVGWCIRNGILTDFLKTHETEVVSMWDEEWDLDTALQVRWEEGREDGREEGQNTVLDLMRKGYDVDRIEQFLAQGQSWSGPGAIPRMTSRGCQQR